VNKKHQIKQEDMSNRHAGRRKEQEVQYLVLLNYMIKNKKDKKKQTEKEEGHAILEKKNKIHG